MYSLYLTFWKAYISIKITIFIRRQQLLYISQQFFKCCVNLNYIAFNNRS